MRRIHTRVLLPLVAVGFFVASLAFFSDPKTLFAISLDKSIYVEGDNPIFTSNGGPWVIYDITINSVYGGLSSHAAGEDLSPFNTSDIIAEHEYSIIELRTDGFCENEGLNYFECVASEEFIGEFQFTGVSIPPSSDGEQLFPDAAGSRRIESRVPQISIFSPMQGAILSHVASIKYRATDQNDNGFDFEKTSDGLSADPVSLFYSDKVPEWYPGSYVRPELKSLIAEKLPPIGEYLWSTARLVPGVFYRVIADVMDAKGDMAEAVSGFFTVDFTAPTFRVSVDRQAVRSGDVTIYVESSEDLAARPEVHVVQQGAKAKVVQMTGSADRYEGVYAIEAGFDGTARIFVSGKDMAGNVGTTTVSGGTFSVGANPPPRPVITEPAGESAVSGPTITLRGTTRADTEVILYVNGREVGTIRPDLLGQFAFQDIELTRKDRGLNVLSVSARDPLGTIGEPSDIEVKYNSAPSISIGRPANGALVNDSAPISVDATDANGDPLLFTYELAPYDGDTTPRESMWSLIGEDLPSSGLVWNATEVDDGEYLLRAIASDGFARATSTAVRVTVRNTLPFFRFDDGRKTVAKAGDATVSGTALTSENLAVQPNITSIEYSTDGGAAWVPVRFDPSYASERRFRVELSGLKPGTNAVLWRVRDSRDLVGRATHLVIVDTIAPKAPSVLSPRSGAELSRENDRDLRKQGVQFSLSGTAEPLSIVTLSYDGGDMTTKASVLGAFSFPDLSFAKRGAYEVFLSSRDEAGNESAEASVSYIYDNPPQITLVHPQPLKGIRGKAEISWSIQDPDGDLIRGVTVEYRRAGGPWSTLVSDGEAKGVFSWDASRLAEDNDYEMRISATDGLVSARSIQGFSIDRSAPTLVSATFDERRTKESGRLTVSGMAADAVSGIESVEYALLREGRNDPVWYRSTISSGYLSQRATYLVRHRSSLEDGKYELLVRAVDASGNVSRESRRMIEIDRTSPRIGSFFIRVASTQISPDRAGEIVIPQNISSTFGISLENDTAEATLSVAGEELPLARSISTGLWEADIRIDGATSTRLVVNAEDGEGNRVSGEDIGSLRTSSRGTVFVRSEDGTDTLGAGAEVRVLKLNEETGGYAPYSSKGGQALVALADGSGEYDLALPPGAYRLVASLDGARTTERKVLIDSPRFIDVSFELEEVSGFEAWVARILDRIRY